MVEKHLSSILPGSRSTWVGSTHCGHVDPLLNGLGTAFQRAFDDAKAEFAFSADTRLSKIDHYQLFRLEPKTVSLAPGMESSGLSVSQLKATLVTKMSSAASRFNANSVPSTSRQKAGDV